MIFIGDVGNKFFILVSGEVTIELPDPDMKPGLFKLHYAQFKELLEEIRLNDELEHKKELVELRKEKIAEMLHEKEMLHNSMTGSINKPSMSKL